MHENVYDPLERYAKEFEKKFYDVVDSTFKQLEQRSGVDRAANQALCRKIKKLEANKEKLESKNSFNRSLRSILVFCIVAILIVGVFSYAKNEVVTGWHGFGIVVSLLFLIFVCRYLNPRIKDLVGNIESLNNAIEGLKNKAWEQMKPLNELYDWGITTNMIHQVVPKLEFDNYVHEGRLSELINDYGLADLPENQSVVAAQSGEINDNPFVVAQILSQDWGTETYYGTKVITWKVRTIGPDGKASYVTRTQTLTASVDAPIPVYSTNHCLIYGNEAAPNLTFLRKPSEHSGNDKNGFFDKLRKKRDMKRLKKFSENLEDESQYTLMGNREFELLFETLNRNDEQEYRILFTPLAQKQMLNLINDRSIGFGDDFTFNKQFKINIITAEHLNSQELDTPPNRYYDFDIDRAEATFKRFNCEYFKALYFAFAPLLAIPIYQQLRPLRKIYGDKEKHSSTWEMETLLNYYGDSNFRGPDFETQAILKAKNSERLGRDARISVIAHGFYSKERVTTVPVFGGDGNMHNVPVHWREYFPISNKSSIMVREYESKELADGDQSVVDEFCDIVNNLSGGNILARRNIFSSIIRKGN